MEYGFNIDFSSTDYPIDAFAVREYKEHLEVATVNLQDYLLNDNITIDAKTVIGHLFPFERCDVFISHSYNDRDQAIQLALDLGKKGITAFVDSTGWGSAYDLLKAIDDVHCTQGELYSYKKRNRSTVHVHMILTTALQQMITNSTALFFLNTDNSLSTKHSIEDESKTHSAWIHMELMFSYFVWKVKQDTLKRVSSNEGYFEAYAMDEIPVVHEATTKHLQDIDGLSLKRWIDGCQDDCTSGEIATALHQLHKKC